MPEERPMTDGRCRILRPLLSSTRREIVDYASTHGLAWVEDESNLDVAQARNHLRHRVLPEIEERFPGYRAVFARTAGHMAESAELLDTLAEQDWNDVRADNGLSLKGLRALSRPRAKNVMRWFLARRGVPILQAARLEEMVDEIMEVAPDSRLNFHVGDLSLRAWKGQLQLTPNWPEGTEIIQPWDGENCLPFAGGVMGFECGLGQGLSRSRLAQAPVILRTRRGGESIRPDCRRPRRELKKLFQELAIPPWQRGMLPLLYVGTTLAWVAGVGMDCEFQAQEGEAGLVISWQPPARWPA
jgi:tRNA(Ile)-lysidine synthase